MDIIVDKSNAAPEGARCAVHADWPSVITCVTCGDYACRGCLQEAGDKYYCASCELPPQLARLGARFNGHLLDSMIFAAPAIPIIVGAILDPLGGALYWIAMIFGIVASLAVMGVNMLWLHQRGQPIGKRVLGTRIVMLDDSPAPLWRIVALRALPVGIASAVLSLIPLGNFIMLIDGAVIFGTERRCVHDYIAGTKVVEAK